MKILMRADTHCSITIHRPYYEASYTLSQIVAALAVSMGSLIIGFSAGYTSPALYSLEKSNDITITKEQATWIGGLMPLAALGGGIVGGPLVDYFGRKRTILSIAFPFFLGWILIGAANTVDMILAGRALCGLCDGIGSLAFPVYLGETIQPEVRGTLGLFPTAIGNIGILLSYIAGNYLHWTHLAYLGASLAVPFFILVCVIPETPRWYITRNRNDDAKKSLQWLRGKNAKVDNELKEICNANGEQAKNEKPIKEMFSRKYRKSILISLGLMAFQQFSGINAVIFYSMQIFEMSKSSVDNNLGTIIVGIVNFASTFIATAVIDRVGRKILLYISSVVMTLTLIILGTFFYVRDIKHMDVEAIGWLPLACLMVYLLGFSLGFGPIPWLMMGEILPAKIRGAAASLCTSFNWLCTFIVTKTFQNIIDGIGPYGTFWLFGGICFTGLFFVIICVPETSGKSLEQIEDTLTGRKAYRTRRMSSLANIKPLPSGC